MKLLDQIKNVVENHGNVTETKIKKAPNYGYNANFVFIDLGRENYDGDDGVYNLVINVDPDWENAIAWDNIDGTSEVSVMNEDVIE